MVGSRRTTSLAAAAMLAVFALGALAPAAEAAHRKVKVGWAGPPAEVRYKRFAGQHGPRHSTYVVRRSDSGAAIGSFLGGLFLGAVLSSVAPHGYAYYDEYCGRTFLSLEIYSSHCRRHHHPALVRMVEVRPGDDYCPPPQCGGDDGDWEGWDD
jgi:hypothetical protein